MKYLLRTCATLIATASPAFAYYTCGGMIDLVALNPSGIVTVTSSAAGVNAAYICSIGSTYDGVSPEVCKAIFAQLVAAQATGSTVVWYYNDALTCTTHPSWVPLTGWYYGPQVGP